MGKKKSRKICIKRYSQVPMKSSTKLIPVMHLKIELSREMLGKEGVMLFLLVNRKR